MYYLDLEVTAKRLAEEQSLPLAPPHVFGPAPSVAGDENLAEALYSTSPQSLDTRLSRVRHALQSDIVPFLRRMSTLQGVREEIEGGGLRRRLLVKRALESLAQET